MIKRRFYRQDHANEDDSSDSSASDSELEPEISASDGSSSTSSGADISKDEVVDKSSDYDKPKASGEGTGMEKLQSIDIERYSLPEDCTSNILKCKSVFKCRLCPEIVCLNEGTLATHLKSKRHARSEKLLKDGKLKLMLNSDGEVEEELETHAERHARTISLAQTCLKRKNKGRQRQRQRLREKKAKDDSSMEKARQSTKKSSKKRLKNED